MGDERSASVGTEGGAAVARLSPITATCLAAPGLVGAFLLHMVTWIPPGPPRDLQLWLLGMLGGAAVAVVLAWPQARGVSRGWLGVLLILLVGQSLALL